MRFLAAAVAIVVGLSTAVFAVGTSNAPGAKVAGSHPVSVPDGRVGGENIATAVAITSLPFGDTGSTCGHVDDYDEVCPYTDSTSPDVVYSLALATDTMVTVDLCDSQYDTKVYVFQDSPSTVVACSDDAGCGYSGYQSKLSRVLLAGGHTYYIVVDGYDGDCGDYVLTVTEEEPCVLECPPGALLEGEPDCYDDYVDAYNGGCNSSPYVWQDIAPAAPGATITLCGKSGTYLAYGYNYRDTDWFRLNVTQTQTITYCCEAEFPLLIYFMDGGTQDCSDFSALGSLSGEMCEQLCLTFTVDPGAYWLWAGPSVFSGVPCGADYIVTIDGYETDVPVEPTSWGSIKALYK